MAQNKISVELVGVTQYINALHRYLRAARTQASALPKKCALDYVTLVRSKIRQQDFTFKEPLGERYAEWKKIHFPNAKTFWHLGGELEKAIQAIDLGDDTWAGTIPAGITDKGGKSYGRKTSTEILKYALTLEYSSSKHNIPARPVFGPAAAEYFLEGYVARLKEVRTTLISKWRL